MLSLAHTLISLPLGIYLNNPLIIFVAAFALHLLCDMIIHWNICPEYYPSFPYKQVATDVLTGPLVAYLMLGQELLSIPVLAAIIGGNMPDIIQGIWTLLKQVDRQRYVHWLNPFFHWHHRIQVETNDLLLGLTPQLVLVAFSFVLVLARAG